MMAAAAVLERRARAVELVQAGMSYNDIAAELGYANRSGAWKATQRALSSHVAESVEELRLLEVARLDALQEALWDKAAAGDVPAGMAILRIIGQRARLLGLEAECGKPGRKRGGSPALPATVVMQSFWDHVGAVHAGDFRVCRCPEIIGKVAAEDICW